MRLSNTLQSVWYSRVCMSNLIALALLEVGLLVDTLTSRYLLINFLYKQYFRICMPNLIALAPVGAEICDFKIPFNKPCCAYGIPESTSQIEL